MRRCLLAILLLAGSAAAAMAAAPAAPLQQYDIPPGSRPQTVAIVERNFAPGTGVPLHIHHGVEITYVIRGDVEVDIQGRAPHVYHAGESFMVPREVPHLAKNAGSGVASIAVTYVIDRGTPLMVPVK